MENRKTTIENLQKFDFGYNLNHNHRYDYDKTESPIERFFLNHIEKYLDRDTQLIIQYPINTISGNFRADIVLKRLEEIIVIECDGKENHTKEIDETYDDWRDMLILVQRKADAIYRIKGTDIYNNLYSILSIMNYYDSIFFDQNQIKRLNKQKIFSEQFKKRIELPFVNDNDEERIYEVIVKRKDTINDFDRFWLKYIMYSLIFVNKNLNELIKIMYDKRFSNDNLTDMLEKKYPEVMIKI